MSFALLKTEKFFSTPVIAFNNNPKEEASLHNFENLSITGMICSILKYE